jgi:hypothetical protein
MLIHTSTPLPVRCAVPMPWVSCREGCSHRKRFPINHLIYIYSVSSYRAGSDRKRSIAHPPSSQRRTSSPTRKPETVPLETCVAFHIMRMIYKYGIAPTHLPVRYVIYIYLQRSYHGITNGYRTHTPPCKIRHIAEVCISQGGSMCTQPSRGARAARCVRGVWRWRRHSAV